MTLCLTVALAGAFGCGNKTDTTATPSGTDSDTSAAVDTTPQVIPEGEQVTYAIDPDYSAVMWNATVPIGTREGGWTLFEGTVTMVEGYPETMTIDVTVDMNSAYADDPAITSKLQGDEHFFKPATYPKSTFKSKGAKKTADGYQVTGDFTIRGITKEFTFPATVTVEGDKLTAQAEVEMDRQDFEITYNSTIGDYAIKDMCKLILDITANKTDSPPA
jgi:polyisoprenoid-binding protein YceI